MLRAIWRPAFTMRMIITMWSLVREISIWWRGSTKFLDGHAGEENMRLFIRYTILNFIAVIFLTCNQKWQQMIHLLVGRIWRPLQENGSHAE